MTPEPVEQADTSLISSKSAPVVLTVTQKAPETRKAARSPLEIVGKGRSGRRGTYICGVSGGGIKSRCYQM
ncbi:hypothetical protein [Actibacterium mucosum]|nr:hypothetical protein [Actibacterium mucosum]